MVYSSLTIEVLPRLINEVRERVESFEGVEVHGVLNNQIVVTVEAETVGECHRIASGFAPLEGVINANLVYANFEEDETLKVAR